MPQTLSTRLSLAPQTLRVVSVYYLSFLGLGIVTVCLGPALPFLAARVGVPLEAAGGIISAQSAGFLVGSLCSGRVLERMRPHGAIQVSLLCGALALLAASQARNYVPLLAAFFFAGFFVSIVDVSCNVLTVWQLRERAAPFLTGLHFVWGLGALLAPIIIVQLYTRTGGLEAPFATIAVMLACGGLLYLRLPSPAHAAQREARHATLPRRPLLALVGLFGLTGVLAVSMSGFIFTYTFEGGWGSEQEAGWVNASYFGAITIMRLLIAILLQRFSAQNILIGTLITVCLACTAMLTLPPSLGLIWVCAIAGGAGQAGTFPLTLALAPQYLPPVGRVTAYMYGGSAIGFITVPWLISSLFRTSFPGPDVVWMVAGASALGYILLLTYLRSLGAQGKEARTAGA